MGSSGYFDLQQRGSEDCRLSPVFTRICTQIATEIIWSRILIPSGSSRNFGRPLYSAASFMASKGRTIGANAALLGAASCNEAVEALCTMSLRGPRHAASQLPTTRAMDASTSTPSVSAWTSGSREASLHQRSLGHLAGIIAPITRALLGRT